MRLPAFTYVAPSSLDEAVSILAAGGTVAVAGGTGLFPNLKRRQEQAKTVLALGGIEGLRGIRTDRDGRVVIGAMTLLSDLDEAGGLPDALVEAARQVASPQIRNMATVGGNLCLDTRCNYYDMSEGWRRAAGNCLKAGGEVCWVAPRGSRCWAVVSSDLAPVAVALEARLRLVSVRGERLEPAADFYRNDGLDHVAKAPDEILTEVVLPATAGLHSSYRKLRRRGSIDFPILGVAAAARFRADGTCAEARIVLGAVAPLPLRATDAEGLLVGSRLTPEVVEGAAQAATRLVRPLDNTDLTPRYRRWMTSVYVSRALRDLHPFDAIAS